MMPTVKNRRRAGRAAGAALVYALCALAGAGPLRAETKPNQDQVPSFGYATSLSGNYLAGRLAGSLKDIESAASYFREALSSDPGNQVLIERAFPLLLADGRIREALPLATRIVNRDKGNQLARMTLGVDALKRGQFDRARSQFSQMATRPLTDLTAAILTGWTFTAQGDVDQALKTVDRLSGPEWYGVFKNFHSGLMAELGNRKAESVKRLAAAYKADPNALRVTDAQARSLVRQGKMIEAAGVLDSFEKVIPDHPLVAELREEITAGRQPGLLISNAQSGAAELLYGLGAAIGQEGGEEMAAVYLQLALYLEPKTELPLVTLASLQGRLKQYDKAIEILERVTPASRIRPMVDIQIGRYYNLLSKFDEARKHLEASLARNPKDVDATMALGDVLRGNKKFAEAAEVYSKAIELIGPPQKSDWSLFYFRGICYERTKQWPKAEADFNKALELNPNEANVLNYLGYSWIDMGLNLDKGLDLVRQAVELKPDDGYIVDSLGWAYYRLGRYEDAVRELERAVLLRPEDPVINDHLGDAYWQVGRQLEATFQWRHSVDLKPEPEDLARVQKKLREGLREQPAPASAQNEGASKSQ
ncbi:tetratricopeptide repeat protein [Prosthecomicrobium sp. N25]|uniref:tetratricopeptide repeat protein n=1 Tax=Prosthecomicrobium sp. N25 TaxID=3129254 RepID=UPI0030775186